MFYAYEIWNASKELRKTILTFERNFYWKMLKIRWTQKVANNEVMPKVPVKENLLQKVIRRKLTLFGHRYRMPDVR